MFAELCCRTEQLCRIIRLFSLHMHVCIYIYMHLYTYSWPYEKVCIWFFLTTFIYNEYIRSELWSTLRVIRRDDLPAKKYTLDVVYAHSFQDSFYIRSFYPLGMFFRDDFDSAFVCLLISSLINRVCVGLKSCHGR